MAIQSKFGNVWTEERPFETKSCAAPRGCGWLLLCLLLTPGQRRPGQPQVGGRTKRRGADTGDQGDRSPDCPLEIQTKANRRFVITEKDPTRAFSWLKAATTAFTFKTLLRHYAERALTPRSLNVKLGPRRNYHKGRAAIRHYANQTARPL